VRAVNTGNAIPLAFLNWRPAQAVSAMTTAIAWFNSARRAIKALSPYYRVGGIGASSG
jgi:hypothetical protein